MGEDSTSESSLRSPTGSMGLKMVLLPVLAAVVAYWGYHISLTVYIALSLANENSKGFGGAHSLIDDMRQKYPYHFDLVVGIPHMLPFTNPSAKAYRTKVKSEFLQAARTFKLHPYWAATEPGPPGVEWKNMIHARVKMMLSQLQATGRRDFMLEKDRCAMFQFMRKNKIAHPRLHGVWRDLDKFKHELPGAVEAVEDLPKWGGWPLFLKACHLTQHSSYGTRLLASKQDFESSWKSGEMQTYIDGKWAFRPHDKDRVWAKEGDIVTASLDPGFLLQSPMREKEGAGEASGRMLKGLIEVRAEVLWGRTYLIHLDSTTIYTPDATEDYNSMMGALFKQPPEGSERVQWVREQGYLVCVADTAERLARAAAIEYVRVDVFLSRGNPSGCVVNEISLSSGYPYYGHDNYMAEVWAEPLRAKSHGVLNSSEPVHEMTGHAGDGMYDNAKLWGPRKK